MNNKLRLKPIWPIKKPIERKDMNWSQAKWNYPRLKPMGDRDRDGVKNQFDCKPFDRKRQDNWKEMMEERFKTVGDLKHFIGEKEEKEEKGDEDD